MAQTTNTGTTSTTPHKTPTSSTSKTAAHKASAARSTQQQRVAAHRTTTQNFKAARYGGFVPMGPPPPPPVLDMTSPRTLSLVSNNTGELLTVTYWADGHYKRDALDKLNHFLRDTHDGAETEMDPLLYDVLWHTAHTLDFGGTIEVLSAYRSPTTNAWLASVSRGVASDSQHINGNAIDVVFPGLSALQVRQVARSLNMGGVGFYPRSGFVHLDTGPVRYW
jgi:uncharacterized protein YcbK (DUF882 family)